MIARRLIRLGQGNPGDFKSVGDGVLEMRIDHGPGYRVYYTVMDDTVVLWGGTKTTQARDIAKAKRLKGDWK
jgi:putative addiction module killer protein